MARPDDIVGYTYKAENWTPRGVLARLFREKGYGDKQAAEKAATATNVELVLTMFADMKNINREDEFSFDSGDFPKVIFRDSVEDDDEEFCNGSEYVRFGDL